MNLASLSSVSVKSIMENVEESISTFSNKRLLLWVFSVYFSSLEAQNWKQSIHAPLPFFPFLHRSNLVFVWAFPVPISYITFYTVMRPYRTFSLSYTNTKSYMLMKFWGFLSFFNLECILFSTFLILSRTKPICLSGLLKVALFSSGASSSCSYTSSAS